MTEKPLTKKEIEQAIEILRCSADPAFPGLIPHQVAKILGYSERVLNYACKARTAVRDEMDAKGLYRWDEPHGDGDFNESCLEAALRLEEGWGP